MDIKKPIVDSAAKGLFAEVERLNYRGEERNTLTFLAAKIALHQGLIRKLDGHHGDLADVEIFLRDFGSDTHLVAMPRFQDMMGRRTPVSYSWLTEEQAKLADGPNYFPIVADSEASASFATNGQGVTEANNLYRLIYTGLPRLHQAKKLENHLLTFVPPLVP